MKTDNELIAEYGFRVFKNGNVRRHKKPFKAHVGSSGYPQINISIRGKTKSFSVHRLVAEKFLPNPYNKPEVNHKNGKKRINRSSNLEWVTRSENMKHGFKTGLISKSMVGRTGKKHWRSKEVHQILKECRGVIAVFESTGDAARKTGYNSHSIQDACAGRLKTYKGFIWKYNQ
jgi:hypothetical protein